MGRNLALSEAAQAGDIIKLQNLLKDDPFLLQRAMDSSDAESPLHIACLGGHLDFVKEVVKVALSSNSLLCTELSPDGYSPLHVASGIGNLDIVQELLKLGSRVCLVKGKDDRIPLHCASAKGRTPVVRELLSDSGCKDSIAEVTDRGENCLHVAVKNNQFQAFKALVDLAVDFDKEDLLNETDVNHNTVLHLVASRKQYQFVCLLLDQGNLKLNELNSQGLTPLDVLISHGGDFDIEKKLSNAGALTRDQMQHGSPPSQPAIPLLPSQPRQDQRPKCAWIILQEYFMFDTRTESSSKVRNMLLVISVLIITATYQAVLSPPGGVWQDDLWVNEKSSNPSTPPHTAGKSVMGTHNEISYGIFLFFNSVGFFMSLHMMNFLTLGVPLHFELQVALFALIVTYDTCMIAMSPSNLISMLFIGLSIMLPFVVVEMSKRVTNMKGRRRTVSPPI